MSDQQISKARRGGGGLNILLGLTLLVLLMAMWVALSIETTTFWTLDQYRQPAAPGRDDRHSRDRRDFRHHHRRNRPFRRRGRGLHQHVRRTAADKRRLARRSWLRIFRDDPGRRDRNAAHRRLHWPFPRFRRRADGPAAVHHDAGDDVFAARHRPADHQRRDDLDRQRRLHRLLARELPRFSLDRRFVVRDSDAVLDGDCRRRPRLHSAQSEPLGALSLRHRLQFGGGAAFRRQRQGDDLLAYVISALLRRLRRRSARHAHRHRQSDPGRGLGIAGDRLVGDRRHQPVRRGRARCTGR